MVTIHIPLYKVQIIYTEFYHWKRETTFLNGNLRKTMPHLVSFIALCDAHTRAKGQSLHKDIAFLLEPLEAQYLINDIVYMIDTPPTIEEVRELLLLAQNIKNYAEN